MTTDLPVKVREYRETDRAFIIDSWVNTMAYSIPAAAPALFWVSKNVIKNSYRQMVGKLLDVRPDLFHVLVNKADDDQIFGWSCHDENATHFVYVKEKFRCVGLGGQLWGVGVVTHWTQACKNISGLKYKPSLFKGLINGLDQTICGGIAEDKNDTLENNRCVESGRTPEP